MSDPNTTNDPKAERRDVPEDLELGVEDAGEIVGGDTTVYVEVKLTNATVSK